MTKRDMLDLSNDEGGGRGSNDKGGGRGKGKQSKAKQGKANGAGNNECDQEEDALESIGTGHHTMRLSCGG